MKTHKNTSRKKSRILVPASVASVADFDLEAYLNHLDLPKLAEQYVRRSLEKPSRYTNNYKSHAIHAPIAKFGHEEVFESRTLEYPFALQTVYRPDVYEIAAQPQKIDFSERDCGVNVSCNYTPDLMVLAVGGVEIWEVKPAGRLAALSAKSPRVWKSLDNGGYDAPLIRKYFEQWGFSFHVANAHNLDSNFVTFARNIQQYITGHLSDPVTPSEAQKFQQIVRRDPGITLFSIEDFCPSRRVEIAMDLISKAKVFTTWSDFNFESDPSLMRLFDSPQDEYAFRKYKGEALHRAANLDELGYRIRPGSLIEIAGVDHEVTRKTSLRVTLRNKKTDETFEISHRALLDQKARIGGIYFSEKTFENLLRNAPLKHRLTWRARKDQLAPYLPGGDRANMRPPERLRKMRDAFLRLQATGMVGDLAIFPKFSNCGRKKRSLPPEFEEALKAGFSRHVLNPKEATIEWLWKDLTGRFPGRSPISKRAIYRRFHEFDPHLRDWKRGGKGGSIGSEPFYGDDEVMGSPNGGRTWQQAHIDSSPLDLVVPSSPRQWVTLLVDSYNGKILAGSIASQRACGEAVRQVLLRCVELHGRLPQTIVADNGSEHKTSWLRAAVRQVGFVLDYRPVRSPRKGGPVESKFSDLCRELIHNLEGNTKKLKEPRLITEAVNPLNRGCWTEAELDVVLNDYINLKNDTPTGAKPSPNAIEQACLCKFGRPPSQVANLEDFRILLAPLASRNGIRIVSPRGTIKDRGRTYGIRGDANKLLGYAGKEVVARIFPEDAAKLMVSPKGSQKIFELTDISCSSLKPDVRRTAEQVDNDRAKELGFQDASSAKDHRKALLTRRAVDTETQLKKLVLFPTGKAKAKFSFSAASKLSKLEML